MPPKYNLNRVSEHRKQLGVYTIINAFVVLMGLAGLGVTVVGQIAWERGRVQGLADMVALTAARELGSGPEFAAAREIAKDNGLLPSDNISISCIIEGQPTLDCESAITARVEIVRQVTPFFSFLIGQTAISRIAEATTAPTVVGYVSSGLINLDTQQSALLNGLLSALGGGQIKLGVAEYGALLNSDIRVDLLDLALQLGVASVEELLSLNLTALNLLNDSLVVGNSDRAKVSQIRGVLSALSVPLNRVDLKIGDLLAVDLSGKSKTTLAVNLGNLAQVALLKSLEGQSYTLPLTVGLLGIAVTVDILQAPQIFIGQKDPSKLFVAEGNAAQIALSLRVKQLIPNINIPGLLTLSVLDIGIQLKVAGGSTRVDNVTCSFPRSQNTLDLTIVPSLVDLCIADSSSNLRSTVGGLQCGSPAKILDLTLLSFIKVGIGLGAQASLRGFPVNSRLTGTAPFLETVELPLSQTLAGLLNEIELDLRLDIPLIGVILSFIVNGLLDFVLILLEPLLRPILFLVGSILDGLLQLLGISLNEVSVSIDQVDCNSVSLTR